MDDDSERPLLREDIPEKVENSDQEETLASCPVGANDDLNTSHSGGSDEAADSPSPKSTPSPVVSQILQTFVWKCIPECFTIIFGNFFCPKIVENSDLIVLVLCLECGS